jgi:hypothetical protein
MILKDTYSHASFAEPVHHDRKAFQRLFRVAFVVFLLIAAVSRLLPRAWRPFASSAEGRESAVAEARRAANTVVPFMFIR